MALVNRNRYPRQIQRRKVAGENVLNQARKAPDIRPTSVDVSTDGTNAIVELGFSEDVVVPLNPTTLATTGGAVTTVTQTSARSVTFSRPGTVAPLGVTFPFHDLAIRVASTGGYVVDGQYVAT